MHFVPLPPSEKKKAHTDEEMRIALNAGARVVGVNNRNLHTFELDLETTERVALVAADMSVPWQVRGVGVRG